MYDFTPIARRFLMPVHRRAEAYSCPEGIESVQRRVLDDLLREGSRCLYGQQYGYRHLRSYRDYATHVPVADYNALHPWIERMVYGASDVLWPGRCRRFAQSSGTSGDVSKYIPVTADSLRLNHYAGAKAAVAHYLAAYPDSRLFAGRSFILGGSYANGLENLPRGVKVGDLSATLIDKVNPLVELLRVPDKKTALMADWNAKLPALVSAAVNHDVSNISGVPSWFLKVLRGVLAAAGADEIHEVWPSFEVFFHGGIAFGPYRSQYDAICESSRTRYVENYNASEGFFACGDVPGTAGMRLLADIGVFYEFLPPDKDVTGDCVEALRAHEVSPGETYQMIISSCNGLWRYALGDTVRVESVNPLRISVAGRTKAFINAFGEELMVWNADAGIEAACRATGAVVAEYSAAPVYTAGDRQGRHQWLIEWQRAPQDAEAFAAALDEALKAVNSDYAAKRAGDIFLKAPVVTTVPAGTFERYLAATGKLGGQRKVPRLCNDRRVADFIMNNLNKNIRI